MKNISSYDEFNESVYGDISRLNPKRYDDDSKFTNLANEMVEDFEKNGKDLVSFLITLLNNF